MLAQPHGAHPGCPWGLGHLGSSSSSSSQWKPGRLGPTPKREQQAGVRGPGLGLSLPGGIEILGGLTSLC